MYYTRESLRFECCVVLNVQMVPSKPTSFADADHHARNEMLVPRAICENVFFSHRERTAAVPQ